MASNTFNFTVASECEVERGDFYRLGFQIFDEEDNPIDLTGKDLSLIIKDTITTENPDIVLTEVLDEESTGLYYRSRTEGLLVIQITDVDTLAMAVQTYLYEMKNNTDKDTLMSGGIQVIDGEF